MSLSMSVKASAIIGFVCIGLVSPTVSWAQNNSDADGKARAEYEKKKDEITYASDYIEKKQKGEEKLLILSNSKHEDALSVKTNQDK